MQRMKGLRLGLGIVVLLLLVAQLLAACSKSASDKGGAASSSSGTSTSPTTTPASDPLKDELKEKVRIKAYAWGAKDKNAQPVLDKLNEKLLKDLNATLEIDYIDWGDADKKVPLLFASGQDFDFINTAYWYYLDDNAKKGGFLPLNDLLQKYAPHTYATVPEERYPEISYNGKIVMVPQWKVPITAPGWVIRKDLREKYGLPPITKWNAKDIAAYFDAVKKNEKDMVPFNLGKNNNWQVFEAAMYEHTGYYWSAPGFESYDMAIFANKGTGEAEPMINASWFPEVVKLVKDWADKGYWSKQAFSNTESDKDVFLAGKSAAVFANLMDWDGLYTATKSKNIDAEWVPFLEPGKDKIWSRSLAYEGVGINAKSKHPERALMVIDKLGYDKDYYNLVNYGIEGVNYTMNPDGSRKPNPDQPFGGLGLAIGTQDLASNQEGLPKDMVDLFKQYTDKSVIPPKTADFKPDLSSIQNQIAAYKNVLNDSAVPLYYGVEKDADKAIEDLKSKLKTAGFDQILAEYNKKWSAHMASKK